MNPQPDAERNCCPEFDPAPWDDKMLQWDNKKFLLASVATFFYMPLNFKSAMKKVNNKVTASGATIPDNLCLSDHTSKWNMDVYVAIDQDIAEVSMKMLSGSYYSKVYEGPYKDTGKWCADYENIVKSKGHEIRKWFMWYTTCPKCAKKYGKNYVVIIGQVE